jgi:hypothetical protein
VGQKTTHNHTLTCRSARWTTSPEIGVL